jgi:hypothetical protein
MSLFFQLKQDYIVSMAVGGMRMAARRMAEEFD